MDFHDEKTLIEQLSNDVWCRLGDTPSWTATRAPRSREELWAYCEALSRDQYKNRASRESFEELQRKVVETDAQLFTERSRTKQMQDHYEKQLRDLRERYSTAGERAATLLREKETLEARLPDLELAEKYKKLTKTLGPDANKYIDALIKRGVPKLSNERNIKVDR